MRLLMLALVLSGLAAQAPVAPRAVDDGGAPVVASDLDAAHARIAQLERDLFTAANEIVHLHTEWAICRASLDSADLTSQAADLVRRCESLYGVPCTWDNTARRVLTIDPHKEPVR